MAHVIEYFYTSSTGRCRKTNQDNFFCNGDRMRYDSQGTGGIRSGKTSSEEGPVFCVFDGMGGEEWGEMAAYLAAKEMEKTTFSQGMEKGFYDFCFSANRRICEKTREQGISSMGTTAAMMRFTAAESGLCNIGDSKIFLLSDGALVQLSYDHVGIAVFGKKPPLTQNLGIPEEEMRIEPYVAIGDHRSGDIYLLCSDGLTDMVSLDRIQRILEDNPGKQAAQRLLDEALENGGRDNITFILLYVCDNKRKGFLEEVRLWLKRK